MFIHLSDSSFKVSDIKAITKGSFPVTDAGVDLFTMAVYLEGVPQPIVHTYTTSEERDEVFFAVRNIIDGDTERHSN